MLLWDACMPDAEDEDTGSGKEEAYVCMRSMLVGPDDGLSPLLCVLQTLASEMAAGLSVDPKPLQTPTQRSWEAHASTERPAVAVHA
jgi:hypothetical protein